MKKRIFLALSLGLLALTACVLPESEDPFERLPEENLEVIEGKLFPFSVSVATRATHRLEQDGKLVGYLASDLVQLAEFEGQEVALEGVWRNEKMRQIFWVEGIKVQSLVEDKAEEDGPQRFTTKRFTMLIPPTWEYSVAPNGVAYFLNKEDPARRVFLTFAVEDYSPEAGLEPNIAMNGFSGVKETSTDENGKEREIITLFSKLGPQKYAFTATYFFDDFETKKAVFDVLQSFVEGEQAVQEVIIAEQKAKAEEEAAKLALAEAETKANQAAKEAVVEEDTAVEKARGLLSGLLTANQAPPAEPDPEPIPDAPVSTDSVNEEPTVVLSGDYTNLIDDRAYTYESGFLGFSLKVPFAHWYRNFGALAGTQLSLGVSDAPINTVNEAKMWVKVLPKDQPSEETIELNTSDGVTIIKKRDDASVFELTGPLPYRDVLWSIADSITQ